MADEELFKRLFQQDHDHQESLLESAEVLSLLYSFNGEDTTEGSSEMSRLAELAEKTVPVLYRDTQEIVARELIQKRAEWRAILPHAVSNNLAKRALKRIPLSLIQQKLLLQGTERMITSFSRRLGYLHDSTEAQDMVTEILATNGWLGSTLTNLSTFGFRVLQNLAPVAPEALLSALERISNSEADAFFTKSSLHAQGFTKIIFHIAYEDPVSYTHLTLPTIYSV